MPVAHSVHESCVYVFAESDVQLAEFGLLKSLSPKPTPASAHAYGTEFAVAPVYAVREFEPVWSFVAVTSTGLAVSSPATSKSAMTPV